VKSVAIILSLLALVSCGPAWLPARPVHLTTLHAKLDQLELDITKDDDLRKNRLRETVAQTKEINAIAAERFLFSNAAARLWTKMNQDLEVITSSLDVAVQGIEYIDKKTELENSRIQLARAEFKLVYYKALTGLIEILCVKNPGTWPCLSGPEEERKP